MERGEPGALTAGGLEAVRERVSTEAETFWSAWLPLLDNGFQSIDLEAKDGSLACAAIRRRGTYVGAAAPEYQAEHGCYGEPRRPSFAQNAPGAP